MSSFIFTSTFYVQSGSNYDHIYQFLLKKLESISTDFKKLYHMRIALTEALNNAVEHGDFPIKITLELYKNGQLVIIIKDSGNGFEVTDKLSKIIENGIDYLLEEALFNVRGRGIYMIFKTVDKVSFNNIGNEIRMKSM